MKRYQPTASIDDGREQPGRSLIYQGWRLALLLIPVLVFLFTGCQKTPDKMRAVKGGPAPAFSLQDFQGEQVSLADYEGKVVIVEFWATWCPPCRESVPATDKLYRKYRDQGLAAVAIAVQDNPDQVGDFVREHGIELPVLMDDGAISRVYGVRGIPAMFFINRKGIITNELEGYRPSVDREIDEKVRELLSEDATE